MNEEPENIKKTIVFAVLKYAGYVTLLAAFITVMLVSFWNVQGSNVLSVVTSPLPVRPPENAAGNVEYVRLNYCKNIDAEGTIVLRMIGEKSIIRLPFTSKDRSPAQCLNTEIPIVVPTYAVDDTYYFQFDITYQINPIKTETVILKSKSFTIKSNGIIKVLDSGVKKS